MSEEAVLAFRSDVERLKREGAVSDFSIQSVESGGDGFVKLGYRIETHDSSQPKTERSLRAIAYYKKLGKRWSLVRVKQLLETLRFIDAIDVGVP